MRVIVSNGKETREIEVETDSKVEAQIVAKKILNEEGWYVKKVVE